MLAMLENCVAWPLPIVECYCQLGVWLDETIDEAVARVARRTPDKIAILPRWKTRDDEYRPVDYIGRPMADLNVCTPHAEQLIARARGKHIEISVRD